MPGIELGAAESSRGARTRALFLLWALSSATLAGGQVSDVGLSSVPANGFFNEGFPPFLAGAGSHLGAALAVGDFDGDGFDDLAMGVPNDDGPEGAEVLAGGAVFVRFGAPAAGFDPSLLEILVQGELGSLREPLDRHGYALAACDFNHDGRDDLAIGSPNEDSVAGNDGSGAVYVHYGSPGAFPSLDLILTQESAGISNESESGDQFGAALACGDFNNDGFADLVIGAADESIGAATRAGMIHIVPGSASGLAPVNLALDQDSVGVLGIAESHDQFGAVLAVGDFNGDGNDDLAVGVPGEANATSPGTGVVQVFGGSVSGLTVDGNQLFSDSTFGGAEEFGEEFGSALAAGDFDGDSFDDLVIGTPLEELGAFFWTGNLTEVFGSASGLGPARSQGWDQDRVLGPGNTEGQDLFGWSLAVGDFDRDGYDDVAVGHPGESFAATSEGAVTVFRGSAGFGLDPAPNRRRQFAAGDAGLPGTQGEENRYFGLTLATGDFDGDGHADLAIGAPHEDVGTVPEAGGAVVLFGALFADGFETLDTALWSGTVPHP